MLMTTELPDDPAGQVPIGGCSAAKAGAAKPVGSASPPATPRPAPMNARRLGLDGGVSRLLRMTYLLCGCGRLRTGERQVLHPCLLVATFGTYRATTQDISEDDKSAN